MNLSNLQTAIFKPRRQIGPYASANFALPSGVVDFAPFSAQVTIEETHVDELEITSHPVEYGASITDHAFKKPCEVILQLGWSNSGKSSLMHDLTAVNTLFSGEGEGGFNYVQEIYNKLLTIQLSRVPIGIVTGKRVYSNMLIRSLTAPTNKESEHALFVTMICREVIVAHTMNLNYPENDAQADPSATGAVSNQGVKMPEVTAFELQPNSWIIGPPIQIHAGGGL